MKKTLSATEKELKGLSKEQRAWALSTIEETRKFYDAELKDFCESKAYKPEKLSKKANDIRRIIIASDFGCKKRSVASLFSVLLGEEILIADEVNDRISGTGNYDGALIVPTGNSNDHDYEIGVPCITEKGASYCVKLSGITGNHLTTRKSELRVATTKEIIETAKKLAIKSVPVFVK